MSSFRVSVSVPGAGPGGSVRAPRPIRTIASISQKENTVSALAGRNDSTGGSAVSPTGADVYYDPFDFEIDSDPYPVWKRLRDERPLYYNERYEFFALSRFDDVERASIDWKTYISSRGTVLELIKSGLEIPPGSIIFEDPPNHDIHRGLLSRVFTPRKVGALEPKIRAFCARTLEPLVGSGGFDFIGDLGAQMPMRTIGMLLGIPEQDQEAIREQIGASLRLTEDAAPPETSNDLMGQFTQMFADYIDWRANNPSDDIM